MMKNDPPRTPADGEVSQKTSPLAERLLQKCWKMLSHNWAWKLGSLALAVCLWGALITSDSALPRDKRIENVRVSVVNAAVLRANGLVVVSGLENVNTVDLRASVPQRNYSAAAPANYTARLDVSQIQQAGEQTLKITAYANNAAQYGTVEEVYDEDVTVTVEAYAVLASVPVEVHLLGDVPEGIYGGALTRSVEAVDISGPKSVVDRVARCVVEYDQSSLDPLRTPNSVSLPYFFEDEAGNRLDSAALTVTAHGQTAALSRIAVSQPVYYLARVRVADELVTGEPAPGYAVSNIRVTPRTVTIAGSQVDVAPYLEADAALYPFDRVDVTGQSRTVSQLLYLNTPGSVEYISNNTVQVVVTILPEEFVNMTTGQ